MDKLTDFIEYLQDRWESDSFFRDQVTIACAVGVVTLGFTLLDIKVRVRSGMYGGPVD